MICVAPWLPLRCMPMSTKVAGADRRLHVGALAAAALPVLTLGAEQCAEHKGPELAHWRVEEFGERE